MKLYAIALSFVLIISGSLFGSDKGLPALNSAASQIPGAFAQKAACPCGPIEHVFTKLIVKRYANNHRGSGLPSEIIDVEGIPASLVRGLDHFGKNIPFIDKNNNKIVHEYSEKFGKVILPVFKDSVYDEKKLFLRDFDQTTALPGGNRCGRQLKREFKEQQAFNAQQFCGLAAVVARNK